jgi:hypothetical protein
VVPDVVTDIPASEESRLSNIDDIVQGSLKPVGENQEKKLHITVKESDGTITGKLITRLAGLRDEADSAIKQRAQGSGRNSVPESSIEDPQQHWNKDTFEGTVKLIG